MNVSLNATLYFSINDIDLVAMIPYIKLMSRKRKKKESITSTANTLSFPHILSALWPSRLIEIHKTAFQLQNYDKRIYSLLQAKFHIPFRTPTL